MTTDRAAILMRTLGFEGTLVPHAESGATTAQAERALGIDASRILKTLLLTKDGQQFVVAIVQGHRRLDVKVVEVLCKMRPLRFATPEEVERATGFRLGGVPPFALAGRCPAYVDDGVFGEPWVIGAGGSDRVGVRFDPSQLIRLGFVKVAIAK